MAKIKKEKSKQVNKKTKEKKDICIQISDVYRINITDGRNKSIEKFQTITRKSDDKDGRWLKGEEYEDWVDINCYCGTYKYAFDKIHDMMVADKIGKKGTVVLKEFYNIYEEKLKYLSNVFDTRFKDK